MMKSFDHPENAYTIKFSIKYQTSPGQNIYILGSIPELGKWKENKFKLKWNEGHIWKGKLQLPKHTSHFVFKFVCISDDNQYKRWEEGPDRIFDKSKFDRDEEVIKLDCMWEHFSINFNIYYPLTNDTEYMQIIGGPKPLGAWFKDGGGPIKMKLSEAKTLGGITGKFWEVKLFFHSSLRENYEFEYRYSIYNPIKGKIDFINV